MHHSHTKHRRVQSRTLLGHPPRREKEEINVEGFLLRLSFFFPFSRSRLLPQGYHYTAISQQRHPSRFFLLLLLLLYVCGFPPGGEQKKETSRAFAQHKCFIFLFGSVCRRMKNPIWMRSDCLWRALRDSRLDNGCFCFDIFDRQSDVPFPNGGGG